MKSESTKPLCRWPHCTATAQEEVQAASFKDLREPPWLTMCDPHPARFYRGDIPEDDDLTIAIEGAGTSSLADLAWTPERLSPTSSQ